MIVPLITSLARLYTKTNAGFSLTRLRVGTECSKHFLFVVFSLLCFVEGVIDIKRSGGWSKRKKKREKRVLLRESKWSRVEGLNGHENVAIDFHGGFRPVLLCGLRFARLLLSSYLLGVLLLWRVNCKGNLGFANCACAMERIWQKVTFSYWIIVCASWLDLMLIIRCLILLILFGCPWKRWKEWLGVFY